MVRLHKLAETVKNEPGKLYPFKCDITNENELLSTFKKITETLGPISILVNNAGVSPETDLTEGDISKWRQILDTNVLALSIASREAISSMKANNIRGYIININSTIGHDIDYFPVLSLYPASKFAVTAYSECLRREIISKKLNIKVTSISLGFVKTEFRETNFGKEHSDRVNAQPGLESSDVADTIVYVLSTPEHVNIKELTVLNQKQAS